MSQNFSVKGRHNKNVSLFFFPVVYIYGISGKDDKFIFSVNTKTVSFNILNILSR